MKKRVILEMLKQAFSGIFPFVFGSYVLCSLIGYIVIWAKMNIKQEDGIPVNTPLVIIPNTYWGWFWFIGFCIFIVIALFALFQAIYNWYKQTEKRMTTKQDK